MSAAWSVFTNVREVPFLTRAGAPRAPRRDRSPGWYTKLPMLTTLVWTPGPGSGSGRSHGGAPYSVPHTLIAGSSHGLVSTPSVGSSAGARTGGRVGDATRRG